MFFDTEFTGLHKDTELLSLGAIIDNDKGETLKEIYWENPIETFNKRTLLDRDFDWINDIPDIPDRLFRIIIEKV